jgi:hypothetical protein
VKLRCPGPSAASKGVLRLHAAFRCRGYLLWRSRWPRRGHGSDSAVAAVPRPEVARIGIDPEGGGASPRLRRREQQE